MVSANKIEAKCISFNCAMSWPFLADEDRAACHKADRSDYSETLEDIGWIYCGRFADALNCVADGGCKRHDHDGCGALPTLEVEGDSFGL